MAELVIMVMSEDTRFPFHMSGALYNARFLPKGIYFLKMFLLMDIIPRLSNDEKKEISEMAKFISIFYSEWFLRAKIPAIVPMQVLLKLELKNVFQISN